jgi:beta-lactamase class A
MSDKDKTKKAFGFIKHTYSIFFVVVIAVFFAGYTTSSVINRNKYENFLNGFKSIRENSFRYKFINPLIGNISAPATDVGIYSDIKGDITSYLSSEEKKGELYGYSFYFRDLNSGLWFGSDESISFFPASLFKLPIAIAIYKEGEYDPSFLDKVLVYSPQLAKENKDIQLNAESELVVGKSYTIKELVGIMLISSDNGAKDLLLSALDMNYFDELFKTVSIVDFNTSNKYNLSSRKYALFLRVLYGSSYLNEEHSEFIMSLLTKSEFKEGLVAGIPGSVQVAHKFGTYQFEEDYKGTKRSTRQLHDCGVVYHPAKPYVICFMTKGKDLETLQTVISHVSSLIYTHQSEDNN